MTGRDSRKDATTRGTGGGSFTSNRAHALIHGLTYLISIERGEERPPSPFTPDESWFNNQNQLEPTQEAPDINVFQLRDLGDEPTEEEPEPEEDETSEIDDVDLNMADLAAFARSLNDPSLEQGVVNLAIHRVVEGLGDLSGLIQAIAEGNLNEAKTRLAAHRRTIQTLLEIAQTAPQHNSASSSQSPNEVILARLQERVAMVSTGALDMHQRLFSISTNGRDKREQLVAELDAVDTTRQQVILLERTVTGQVAQFALIWERRDDTTQALSIVMETLERAGAHIEQIRLSVANGARLASELESLEAQSVSVRREATRVVTQLRQLLAAAEALGTPVPVNLFEDVRGVVEPIELAISRCGESFRAPELPTIDMRLADVIEQIKQQQRRLDHLNNPIRPSEFMRRLDRDEELRRLVLVAYHLLTPAKGNTPHQGRSKRSGVEILREANLIDHSELERSVELVVALKDMSPKLLETNQVGRWWRYRPTQAGRTQADTWIRECTDARSLARRIETGRKAYNATYRAKRKKTSS